ncbi:MAG: metal ABC transporter substrate-binding protein [Oscillospiraceae bacterium]|jgi:zinc transport system substrate-binding protein|nr:metal ABC transporter substrate-binding protein [Oscillospiraceae bacterium]
MKRALFTRILAITCAAMLCVTAMIAIPALASDSFVDRISVVATIYPPYDLSRAVTGGLADVAMLLPPGSESHSFEPTPRDILAIQDCDVFIYVGGESDDWINDMLDSLDMSAKQVVTLIDCVEAVEEEIVEGMEEEEEEEETEEGYFAREPEYDEHVWTSPRNASLIVDKITDALAAADPANADAYRANADAYQLELDALDAAFQEVVGSAERRTIVFGDRFPFRYLADAYGLEYYAAFPGCSTETEPSAATVKFLIDKIRAEDIPVVFHLELSNKKMAETISESTGAAVRLLHAAHNISKDDFEAGLTYLDIQRANVETLREALGEASE